MNESKKIKGIKIGMFIIIIFIMNMPTFGSDIQELVFINRLIEYNSSKRDGSLGSLIDNAIVELIIISPENTLRLLNNNRSIRDTLLKKWQFTVFTDYIGNNQERLVKLKSRLLETLVNFKPNDNNINKVKDDLVKSLNNIRIRTIE